MDLTIGAAVEARGRGRGTIIAITSMQAQVRPDDGDDPYWILRNSVAIVDHVDEEREPTMRELIDNACACLEVVRMQLAARDAKEENDATQR